MLLVAYAHPGRTDGSGGHYNRSTGEYHYHHGYSAHDHYDMDKDGDVDCPYDFNDKTDHRSNTERSEVEKSKHKEDSSSDWEIIGALAFILFFWFVPPILMSYW
jgi:hypothetical protein